jgi:hypothetical protein
MKSVDKKYKLINNTINVKARLAYCLEKLGRRRTLVK